MDVAVDADGTVYIADEYSHRVRRVDAATGSISTFAGTGERGFAGDAGPATEARLHGPSGVAVDAIGNVYIADTSNHRVRRVDVANGTVHTLAGGGQAGFGGDGGPAADALLHRPVAVATGPSGNVYIADAGNHRVRRVDIATGEISTFAGTGWSGFSGDGAPAVDARLHSPAGVAVDASGNVYIADSRNWRVRLVDAATGDISTFAGGGSGGDGSPARDARLPVPRGVAVGASGDVYISGEDRLVRWVDAASGIMSTFAGREGIGDGGPGENALLRWPEGVAVDASGSLFIADTVHHRVRRVGADGDISTFAGAGDGSFGGDGGPATASALNHPTGVAVDTSGNVYIADEFNHRIRRVDAVTGDISTFAGSGPTWTSGGGFGGDGGPAVDALLYYPEDVAVDASGHVYVADTFNQRIRRIDASTGEITTVAGSGDNGFGRGGFEGDGGPAVEARLNEPSGVAVDASGNLYIADTRNRRVRRVDAATGAISTVAGTGELDVGAWVEGGRALEAQLWNPTDVVLDAMGNIYIADGNSHRVRRVEAATGAIATFAGSGAPGRRGGGFGGDRGPAVEALLNEPSGVAVGPFGEVYIADTGNDLVRRVSRAGTGVVGDLDGDGRDDVLLRHGDGRWHYYPMRGRRHVAAGRGAADLPRDRVWSFAAMGDFDGRDGAEVLVRHGDGRWWRHSMAGRKRRAEPAEVPLPRSRNWRVGAVGDLDGDGRDGVLLRHVRGNWRYYPMDGSRVADGAGGATLPRSLDFRLAGVGDFGGDGKEDVLLRHRDGRWIHYPMDGRRSAGRRVPTELPTDPDWRLAGVGDFDGDGVADVLLRHAVEGRWRWYRSADAADAGTGEARADAQHGIQGGGSGRPRRRRPRGRAAAPDGRRLVLLRDGWAPCEGARLGQLDAQYGLVHRAPLSSGRAEEVRALLCRTAEPARTASRCGYRRCRPPGRVGRGGIGCRSSVGRG